MRSGTATWGCRHMTSRVENADLGKAGNGMNSPGGNAQDADLDLTVPDLTILVQDPHWQALVEEDRPLDPEAVLRRALAATLAAVPAPAGLAERGAEVALVLTDDAAMQELNREWRGIDRPTDVLSFPGDDGFVPPEEPLPLGDIVLARETILRDARALGRSLAHHLSHMGIHGMLHLLGWDHAEDGEAERMEAQERRILRELGFVEDDPDANDGGVAERR